MSEFSADEIRVLKALAAGLLGATGGSAAQAVGPQPPAPDSELLGRYGDPVVRKDPKRWAGDTCVDLPYSQCPVEYLEVMAEFLEWKAGMDMNKPDAKKHTNGTPYWQFNLKDARLARGWIRRIQSGAVAPPKARKVTPQASSEGDNDGPHDGSGGQYEGVDEIPF